ncbi:MAG: hypothetical protein VB018_04960 [Lachnospiraceae bacterium]|nr:hypothetical protein [Lachnospiraceae bacterium]
MIRIGFYNYLRKAAKLFDGWNEYFKCHESRLGLLTYVPNSRTMQNIKKAISVATLHEGKLVAGCLIIFFITRQVTNLFNSNDVYP